jgi:hypothetical protein
MLFSPCGMEMGLYVIKWFDRRKHYKLPAHNAEAVCVGFFFTPIAATVQRYDVVARPNKIGRQT